MGRTPCCEKNSELKRGPWTQEEDKKLMDYINKNGHGNWRTLPKNAGLQRCGKSCRLRWTNYLRPDIKRGRFSFQEEEIIISLHSVLGNKWAAIASRLPGRTDNEIKNYWNTHIRKRMLRMGIDPVTHKLLGLSSSQPLLPCNYPTTHDHHGEVAKLIMEGINVYPEILMIANNLMSSSTSAQYNNITTYPQAQYQMDDVPQQQIQLLPSMHEVQHFQSSVPCIDLWGESLLSNGNGMVDYNSCFSTTPQNFNNFVSSPSTNLNSTSTYINSGITTEEDHDMDSFTGGGLGFNMQQFLDVSELL